MFRQCGAWRFTKCADSATRVVVAIHSVISPPPPFFLQAEIKEFIEKVYGLAVEKVNTCNYLGRKKHGKAGFYRRPDYKKAFVFLKEEGKQASSQ